MLQDIFLKSVIPIMLTTPIAEELLKTLMTTMCLMSGLFILVGVLMNILLIKTCAKGPMHDRGYSLLHGDKYNSCVGLRSHAGNQILRNRVYSEPRWVSLMLKSVD
jgi:hypothetical protein